MLVPDTSVIFAWADAPPTGATLASLSNEGMETLVLGFVPSNGGAFLGIP